MLGEFNRPGEYSVYESKFNIFDAIAQAGDLTTFAKRNKIYLVRQTESGSKVVHLDLNDIGILESEYYTIMPNDIIYAQPVKGKNLHLENSLILLFYNHLHNPFTYQFFQNKLTLY